MGHTIPCFNVPDDNHVHKYRKDGHEACLVGHYRSRSGACLDIRSDFHNLQSTKKIFIDRYGNDNDDDDDVVSSRFKLYAK
jgi:hypothetical protein